MRETDWTKVLGWPGYRVYRHDRHEINEAAKTLKLWVRRKRGNRKLVCSGCGRKLSEVYDTYEREVRDLPCFEFRTTVVIELYRVRCPMARTDPIGHKQHDPQQENIAAGHCDGQVPILDHAEEIVGL
jgi:hypothetical protein